MFAIGIGSKALKASSLIASFYFLCLAAAPFQNHLASETLKNTYASQFYSLPPMKQGHYAIRLYRMTGEKEFLNASLGRAYRLADKLALKTSNFKDDNYIIEFIRRKRNLQVNTYKGNLRRTTLQGNASVFFYASVVSKMAQLDDLGLKSRHHEYLITELKQIDFKTALLDPKIIRAWSTLTGNQVYWLHQLGIADLREEYHQAFRVAFREDKPLPLELFTLKLYGMTHILFPATRYYQKQVRRNDFAWIYDYFESHIERILAQGTADIIAEVGVAFLLAGEHDHPVVRKCRQTIRRQIHPKWGRIPSPTGDFDLAMGEHRNVLALMLLSLPANLRHGPYLGEHRESRLWLPKTVVSIDNRPINSSFGQIAAKNKR